MPRDGCNIEPNRKEWTSFQSIVKEKEGYILVRNYLLFDANSKLTADRAKSCCQGFLLNPDSGFRPVSGLRQIVDNSVLVFREINAEAKKAIETWLPVGKKVSFKIITGDSKTFESQVIEMGKVVFELPQKNSFSLYKYLIR